MLFKSPPHNINRAATKVLSVVAITVSGWALLAALAPSARVETGEINRIVIDAGHGGKDPGNLGTGRYKVTEKTIALDVSLMLGKYIEEAFPDVEVVYTRSDDSYPELHERTKLANRSNADLFISIHCDAHNKPSAKGSSTYVMGLAKSAANLEMAKRENAAILNEKNYKENYDGFDPNSPEGLIELSMRQNIFLNQSLNFGKKVQDQFRTRVGRVDRGVRQAPFWVISFTTMPSVLIELGFLTNPEEEDFLQTQVGRDYMASAIYRAFKEYKLEHDAIKLEEASPKTEERPTEPAGTPPAPPTAVEDSKPTSGMAKADKKLVRFGVQVASSSQKVALDSEQFNGLSDVYELATDGVYKYISGNFRTYSEALNHQKVLRSGRFAGAFVVAHQEGKRVDLQEAIEVTANRK